MYKKEKSISTATIVLDVETGEKRFRCTKREKNTSQLQNLPEKIHPLVLLGVELEEEQGGAGVEGEITNNDDHAGNWGRQSSGQRWRTAAASYRGHGKDFWGWGRLEVARVAQVRARPHGHCGARAVVACAVHDAAYLDEERSQTWAFIRPSRSISPAEKVVLAGGGPACRAGRAS